MSKNFQILRFSSTILLFLSLILKYINKYLWKNYIITFKNIDFIIFFKIFFYFSQISPKNFNFFKTTNKIKNKLICGSYDNIKNIKTLSKVEEKNDYYIPVEKIIYCFKK